MTLEEAVDFVHAFFNNDVDKIRTWWTTSNPHLGGQAPIFMIFSGRTQKLCKWIEDCKEGNFE